jgi:hypothetical protein
MIEWMNVGASLLAKAVAQLAKVLNLLPPSRAGSLPQGISHNYPGVIP